MREQVTDIETAAAKQMSHGRRRKGGAGETAIVQVDME
jgi:hypothetical protein